MKRVCEYDNYPIIEPDYNLSEEERKKQIQEAEENTRKVIEEIKRNHAKTKSQTAE